jgi:hypothetical protein
MKKYAVDYTIRSSINRQTVAEDSVLVNADDEERAREYAGPLIEESMYFDPRIDPYYEVTTVEEIATDEEAPTG